MKKKLDLIWNVTRLCGWSCDICCVDAVFAKNSYKEDFNRATLESYAAEWELSVENKKLLIDNISALHPRVDISGGDPFILNSTYEVLEYACNKLGKDNITVTTTGGIDSNKLISFLKNKISELNISFDYSDIHLLYRDKNYSSKNLELAKLALSNGINVRAECPLTIQNSSIEHLEKIYMKLHEIGIAKLLLMRLFNVGRANLFNSELTKEKYLQIYDFLKTLENKYQYPKISFQCALKNLFHQDNCDNPCDLGVSSFGITPKGDLILSPWSYGLGGNLIDENFRVGSLIESSLEDLLKTDIVHTVVQRNCENFGHCKVHAFLNSNEADSFIERLLSNSDRLFLE